MNVFQITYIRQMIEYKPSFDFVAVVTLSDNLHSFCCIFLQMS